MAETNLDDHHGTFNSMPRRISGAKKKHQPLQASSKQSKSALSNEDIEQILRNQEKKSHKYNVPVRSTLVAKKPPVEF